MTKKQKSIKIIQDADQVLSKAKCNKSKMSTCILTKGLHFFHLEFSTSLSILDPDFALRLRVDQKRESRGFGHNNTILQ